MKNIKIYCFIFVCSKIRKLDQTVHIFPNFTFSLENTAAASTWRMPHSLHLLRRFSECE